jgi:hypothetical protein
VFRNRRANALKLLLYDGQGFWLCYPAPLPGSVPMVASRRNRRLSPLCSRIAYLVVERPPRGGSYGRRLAMGRLSGRQLFGVVPGQPGGGVAKDLATMPL